MVIKHVWSLFMKIWKGISLSLSFKSGLMELKTGADRLADNIDIGINYIF